MHQMGCHIGWEEFRRLSVRSIEIFIELTDIQHDTNEKAILKGSNKKKL
jgi:hypothetical protein